MISEIEYPNDNIKITCSIEQQYEPCTDFTRKEIQSGTDIDLHNYPGCLLTFKNGEQLKVLYYGTNQIKYFVQGQWIDIQQIDEKMRPLIQSFEQQTKVDMIKLELINFDFNQKYTGYLQSEYINKQTQNIFTMYDLFKVIQNIDVKNNKILKVTQSLQGYEIIITLEIQKINTLCSYVLNCQLYLSNDKGDQQLIHQQQLERNIKQLEKQILGLQNKIDQIVSQSLMMWEQSDLRIRQLEQQLIQLTNKPQPNRVSLSSLQQGDQGYLATNVFQQGFYEFVAVLQDNDIEFEIGILANGDFGELGVKAKAFYFEFPGGTFRRGAEVSEKIMPYSFQKLTKIGIKVNTVEHWIAVSLNGYDFAPINLPEKFENFAFIVKIMKEGFQLADALKELNQ